jgi:hypothetical protein
MTPSEVAALADTMRQKRIIRAKIGVMEVELHPSAFVQDSAIAEGEPEPPRDFLFASSIPVTSLETQAEPPAEAAAKP